MNWMEDYKRKTIEIAEAVAKIQSDNDVVVAMCASEPQGCMEKFQEAAPRVENVRVFSCLTLKPYDFFMKPE
ncbi:MAG: Ach1, partial [Spirochaetes bacterium]